MGKLQSKPGKQLMKNERKRIINIMGIPSRLDVHAWGYAGVWLCAAGKFAQEIGKKNTCSVKSAKNYL